jgi:hypothetical protein
MRLDAAERVIERLQASHDVDRGALDHKALKEISQPEAIPHLIARLAEDPTRGEAEAALRKLGAAARPALVAAALNPLPSAEGEALSSLRARRSAVAVLCEVGVTLEEWMSLRTLMAAPDEWLAALACKLGLAEIQPMPDRVEAVRHLIPLLGSVDRRLVERIEDWLAAHYEVTNRILIESFDTPASALGHAVRDGPIREALLRVTARATRVRDDPTAGNG